MVLLLAGAAVVYLWIGQRSDAVAALVAAVPIVLVSVALELRTERALEQLRRLVALTARARRDGRWREIPAEDVVRGDLVEIREGDVVPADGRVLDATGLHLDESPLTGESDAIAKTPDGDALVFSGTRVLTGRGEALVEATGMATRYGAVAALLAKARRPATPLQLLVRRLFISLTAVALVVCAAVVALELARGSAPSAALIAGISLAMAAIPEEIPVVSALYLGLGAWRLARDRALVRSLAGVETLGMTTVICTDKTGTLTEGRVRVSSVEPAPGTRALDVLGAAVLASETVPFDPLDRAVVDAARAAGVDVDALRRLEPLREHAFEARGKYVSRVWRSANVACTYAKGSPETILALAVSDPAVRAAELERVERLAREGHRLIAVAEGPAPDVADGRSSDERALRYLGLVALSDPLRPDVAATVGECRGAGILLVLVTGDHPATAAAVARAAGLATGEAAWTAESIDAVDDLALVAAARAGAVFARTRPDQKLRIVRALRDAGEIVAVTGDGINDAPALREAHVGIAMGASGTAVAREAATLVLLDDDLTTIVGSVRDGRRIFDNLGRAISYLVAFHIPLVLVALALPLVGAPLLLLPLHLVWLEVIVHPTSSLVFEADPPAPDLMRRPPRPAASLFAGRRETVLAVARGVALAGGVLALFLVALPDETHARTIAVTALIAGQTLLVLATRAGDAPVWRARLANPVLLPILGVGLASVALVPAIGPLADLLRMRPLDLSGWAVALAVAAVAVLAPEALKRRR